MTPKQIQYFLAVYRNGNITATANELFVSRPVISRAIHELEEFVGVRLFARILGGIKPTPAGDILYKMLDEFSRVYELTMKHIRSAASERDSGSLRIGIANGCGNWFYPLVYKRFRTVCPDVSVTVEGIPCEDASSLIVDGVIDAAIAPIMNDTYFSLGSFYLYTAKWGLCAPRAENYLDMDTIKLEDCKALPVALLETLPPPVCEFTNIVLSTREPEKVQIAISSGLSCSILPYELCGAWNDVRFIPLEPEALPPMHLLWNKLIRHGATFEKFLDTVAETDFGQLRKTYGLYIAAKSDIHPE
jgi:DNA-binding transcriptional LysR family regulator